jgi:hypothetical protein
VCLLPYVGPHVVWIGAVHKDRMAKPTETELHEPVKIVLKISNN